jgi:DNA-binding MltR family transcriptional regulator
MAINGLTLRIHLVTKDASLFSVWNELRNQTDRGIAVLGGAVVDDAFKTALTCLWRSGDEMQAASKLLQDSGPFTHGMRLDLAYLSRLIGPDMYNDLTNLNKMRNMFAHRVMIDDQHHKPSEVSFSTQTIADGCKKLEMLNHARIEYDGNELSRETAKERYLFTVILFHYAFTMHSENKNGTSRETIRQFMEL